MLSRLRLWPTLWLILGAGPVWADLQPMAEAPPKSFKGEQYIDSRGCVFMRAGGGKTQVSWVARVNSDRRQMCGARPSVAPEVATIEAAAAPVEAAVNGAETPSRLAVATVHPLIATPKGTSFSPKPKEEVIEVRPTAPSSAVSAVAPAPLKPVTVVAKVEPKPAVPPVVAPRAAGVSDRPEGQGGLREVAQSPAQSPLPASSAAPTAEPKAAPAAQGGYQCPPARPVLQRVNMRSGETIYLCARQKDDLSEAVAPVLSAGAKVAPSQGAQVVAEFPDPPAGYRRAWTDDRLNPYRGISVTP